MYFEPSLKPLKRLKVQKQALRCNTSIPVVDCHELACAYYIRIIHASLVTLWTCVGVSWSHFISITFGQPSATSSPDLSVIITSLMTQGNTEANENAMDT